MTNHALAIAGLTKSYGDKVVLKGIDLTIDPHQVVSLIGASGSGKSTLLRCINLLEPIDAGTVEFFGQNLADENIDADKVRRHIGIVFQSFNLFPHRSVLDNITLAPRRVRKLLKGDAEGHAFALLERFGLSDKAREYPDRLSGGQQQRVAIVRALAMEPRIMLFDEITSALDPELVREVLEVVKALALDGMTMIMATHEMGFAKEVSSKVCFLEDGEIVEHAHPDELFENPRDPRTKRFLGKVLEN